MYRVYDDKYREGKIINQIKVVLVGTTHPGNIGAAARAMKTMGVHRLELVKPKIFPSTEATALASGADDILDNVIVHQSLADAVKDCAQVFGTSARIRSITWPIITPEEAGHQIAKHQNSTAQIAIVFGRESSGLTNEELELCNKMICIPSIPAFSSLNIAAAVQIICYEIHKNLHRVKSENNDAGENIPLVTLGELELLYEHLQACMVDIGFFNPEKPRLLMRRLKRLFNRAQLDQNEYNILRGILAAAQKAAKKEKD